ncbi:pyridoxal phosphate-dependent transferase [Schizothecium vesticola]|uniref:Pyridoxal phosphate-dependent transferase n=1 Tax=Schizothecium vesticola TaxID=314040 RepID=A0AA40ERI3_9PEZI|nr:pyridoxal phosphate-dependent transferase [Schizothecium vesticola]
MEQFMSKIFRSVFVAGVFEQAASALLSDPSLYVPALQYGPDPGYQPLREALATWLGQAYSSPDTPDEICITGGASQSVACILQSFTDVGVTRGVWVVEPGYFLVGGIIRDAGLGGVMRGVKETGDGGGIDVVALGEGMREVDEEWEAREAIHGKPMIYKPHLTASHRKLYRHLIYLVPTLNNPSATTLSLPRRRALVTLARAHDALLLCDDVYDFLQWPTTTPPTSDRTPLGPLLPRLSTLDMALGPSPFDPPGKVFGHALSNGTFSKLAGPGVRTGWVHAAPDLAAGLAHTGSSRSGGAPSQVAAAVVCRVVQDGGLTQSKDDNVMTSEADHGMGALDAVFLYACLKSNR